ncbi:MAG TPA: pitrilysin family protein [bacterium]|nr:pitrilysin family protein [bacterium]
MKTEIRKETLDCGAVLLVEPLPHLLTTSIGFTIAYGSRCEPENMYGAAHFIEHMIFKGTPGMGPRDLALAIESVGGSIGAAASEEKTYCYARVLPEHLGIAVDIISDMFCRSTFPLNEFDLEKEVILEEIKAHEDTPEELVLDQHLEDIYGNSGLGHSILGEESTINNITRDSLFDLYKKIYRPSHAIISVAGNTGDIDIASLINKALSPDGGQPCHVLESPPSPPDFTTKIRLRNRDTHQTQLCLGAPGVEYHNEKRYVYTLLDVILSGGMSSRLFQEIRERRGLVYDISSMNTCFIDSGFFTIMAGTRPENLIDVLSATTDELLKVKDGDVSEQELDRVKEMLRVSISMSFESVTSRMMKLARSQIYYGRPVTDEEIFDSISAVTVEDITIAANEIFRPGTFVFSALGPFENPADTESRIIDILDRY